MELKMAALILDQVNALTAHLNSGKENNFAEVKTLQLYAGQLTRAISRGEVIKLREPVPAVYPILIKSKPVAVEPEHYIDLLIVTESQSFEKLDKHTDALTISGKISSYLIKNQSWQYLGLWYTLDESYIEVQPLTVDERYTVFRIALRVVEGK